MLLLRPTPALSLRALVSRVATRTYTKDYASSDDEKEPKKKQKKENIGKKQIDAATAPASKKQEPGAKEQEPAAEESAVSRLNRLLASMPTEDHYSLTKKASTTMAHPGASHKKRKEAAKQDAASKDIFVAAKRVASMLGEDQQKQTESELLAKLLGHDQMAVSGDEPAGEELKKSSKDLSLSELIVGMKIDRTEQRKEESRGEFVRRTLAAKTHQTQVGRNGPRKERKREAESYTGSVNLFGGEPLGIFRNPAELREVPDMLQTWAQLQQHELKLQILHPPANYFEKLALWTEQGKVWRFPIDNEQDMKEETEVDFSEHIFLEQHLEPWCPTKGPIRHFMELVCVGLSKNPYISAKDKKEHILWYRDYFEAKKDILRDLMNKEKMQQIGVSEQV